jgi:hypothetical protein
VWWQSFQEHNASQEEQREPRPPDLQAATALVDRRDYSVLGTIEALQNVSQPQLLRTLSAALRAAITPADRNFEPPLLRGQRCA